MQYVNTWWAIIQDGITHIKPIQGLVIAIVFGLLANSFGAVFVAPLIAAAAYVAVSAALPVVLDHKAFVMPVFDTAFWHFFLALYVAFLVVAAIVYALKSAVSAMRG